MSDDLIDFSRLEKGEIRKPTHKKKKSVKNISSAGTAGDRISAKDIISSLNIRFENHKYRINNAFIFSGWESDFLSVSEAGYLYEVEIKITKSDFKDDFNKKDKHILLEAAIQEKWHSMPNKFFYAIPKNMLSTHEIPPYAGLIEVDSRSTPAVVIKEAPFLHKEKIFEEYQKILLQKFAWRYWNLYGKLEDDDDISFEE